MNTLAPLDPLRLPLHGIRLIEASAGTGKTWTIAALYLRLVLGHGGEHASSQPWLPAQILVLTFTKAATAELRERIRARLTEAAGAFRGRSQPDDFLSALIAQYPDADARAGAARQLELAAQWMDEASVYTIHGWCQRMLGQHAFDSGHAFVQDTEADESALLAEAVRDYWRQQFFVLDSDGAAQINKLWKAPDALQKALRPLLRQAPESLQLHGRPLSAVADLQAELTTQIAPLREAQTRARDYWMRDFHEIEALLTDAMNAGIFNANMMRPANFSSDLLALWRWAGGAACDDVILARYTQAKLISATKASSIKQGFSPPKHPAFVAMGELLEQQASLSGWKPLILAHAAPWVAQRLDNAKRQRAQLGFDDMLKRLDAALHGMSGERLTQTLATQYPVALIDEFQDTDPLQWRIFQRIYAARDNTAHDRNGLLLIGDPKQAIYSFRGADIHTYLRARDAASHPTWTLTTNYRSTDAMVKAVNRVFEFGDRHAEGAFGFGRGARGLPFHPVHAHDRAERLLLHGQPLPALQLALQASEQPISSTAYQQAMAEQAAAYLVYLLDAAQSARCGFVDAEGVLTPLSAGDIAILVRSGKEAVAIRTALQRRGLKSVFLSDRDSVYASAEAADVLLWLRACAEPGSDRAMRAALAGTTMGRNYAELDRLNLDERYWEQCGEWFRRLHESWLRHGVLAMLHDLLHLFDLPAALLARSDGERALANLLHLAELLQQAAAGLDGEHALIRHLTTQIAQAEDAQSDTVEEQIVRLESEDALIKVVTIHKSKGLEYPLVLMPFACSARTPRAYESVVWHDANGTPRIDLQADADALAQADRERLQEDLRLLYVALTRARHACWLGIACYKVGNAKASALHKSAFGYLLSGGEAIEPADLLPRLREMQDGQADIHIVTLPDVSDTTRFRATDSEQATLQPARHYHGASPERWWIASYSALKYADTMSEQAQSAAETATQDVLAEARAELSEPFTLPPMLKTAVGMHAFPRGAEPGTFLHGLFEWAAEEGFATVAATPAMLEEPIAQRCQRRGWQAWSKPLLHWLPELLRTPLALPGTSTHTIALAALADTTSYRAELEFWIEAQHVDTLLLDKLVSQHTLDARPRVPLLQEQLNGMLKGFIDLVFEHQGRYYVVDYKSNWLGDDASAYTADAMRDSILRERYDLQYAIYTLALHRQLRARLPHYNYERHMGGALYLYLRGVDANGHGVHRERLSYELIDAMDRLFNSGGHANAAR
ncbi:exodeoxyribonuclease V subunit beta [Dyella tabacisoli]|uniref:RecBCD enzyme subunit RecB n=1 Tax=Dyella tabacisoli TaxID=2282381 RepID=A0A369UHC1_9GAMM|nr:exodeoxyribonuclease V subunit beta [Dyella tabacisoli]RDD79946.1 exodeoxyribonuclease V subunit beta [Dyella tabacisoli]